MKITKREILASVTIIAVMLIIGFILGDKISTIEMDANSRYDAAIHIDNKDLFQYGMDTNVGDAFVYGKLKAVDTVSYPELSGKYMYVEKVKEKYTRHTRTVTTSVNGKTTTRTEVYWTWDRVGSEDIKCKKITFCDVKFNSNKIDIPSADYIDTIKESSHIRYKYYGTGTEHIGTIFAELKDKTIKDGTNFYENKTIEETMDYLQTNIWTIIFWIFWVCLICGIVYGFFYLENRWLE